MPGGKKPPEGEADQSVPFGAGLGTDFRPLGRKIVIRPRHNGAKLKKRKTSNNEETTGEKTDSEDQP